MSRVKDPIISEIAGLRCNGWMRCAGLRHVEKSRCQICCCCRTRAAISRVVTPGRCVDGRTGLQQKDIHPHPTAPPPLVSQIEAPAHGIAGPKRQCIRGQRTPDQTGNSERYRKLEFLAQNRR